MISSTASQLPILGKGAVESALKQRRHKPIFMVDIAVPRDIETEVGELDDVYLYTVDDLHDVVAENLKSRQGRLRRPKSWYPWAPKTSCCACANWRQWTCSGPIASKVSAFATKNCKGPAPAGQWRQPRRRAGPAGPGPDQQTPACAQRAAEKLSAEGRLDALAMAQELFALNEGSTDKSPQ